MKLTYLEPDLHTSCLGIYVVVNWNLSNSQSTQLIMSCFCLSTYYIVIPSPHFYCENNYLIFRFMDEVGTWMTSTFWHKGQL